MRRFPYITDYCNHVFAEEVRHADYRWVRPALLVGYFLLRCAVFPLKFCFHRRPWGFEAALIDRCMAFGMKYLARADAAELFLRHVQIEPLLYRHLLHGSDAAAAATTGKLNGIDGDFSVEDLRTVRENRLTVGHDELSYEIVDRFDRDVFLRHLDSIRRQRPEDHATLSKAALEENRRHSLGWLGPTNVVLLVVTAITVIGDLKTSVTALNSFGSDSILLWCLKRIYLHDPDVSSDLDFFMQETANRGHYHSSVFFSNPSRYLYYHIVFDEVAYELLRNRRPSLPA